MNYKPRNYNSVAPYLVTGDARRLAELLKIVFKAEVLRVFEDDRQRVVHMEVRIDDSVIMLSDGNEVHQPMPALVHVYVPDVDAAYQRAIDAGCEPDSAPRVNPGEIDKRGGFKDFAGNLWSVSTQTQQ